MDKSTSTSQEQRKGEPEWYQKAYKEAAQLCKDYTILTLVLSKSDAKIQTPPGKGSPTTTLSRAPPNSRPKGPVEKKSKHLKTPDNMNSTSLPARPMSPSIFSQSTIDLNETAEAIESQTQLIEEDPTVFLPYTQPGTVPS